MEENRDRLSDLDPDIIHHIMSYLSQKQVIRTSILSKNWNYLQKSCPILDFTESYTYFVGGHTVLGIPNEAYPPDIYIDCLRQRVDKYTEFVDDSLLRFCQRNGSMQQFRLAVPFLESSFGLRLDKWLRLVVERNIRDLDFIVESPRARDFMYTLPRMVFQAKNLVSLMLGGCNLEMVVDVNLPYLKRLTLGQVSLNEEKLQKIISNCPLLEDLSLWDCLDLKRIYVSSCKLKRVKVFALSERGVEGVDSVQIVAPSLEKFELEYVVGGDGGRPGVIDMAGCPNLKVLYLGNVAFTDQEFQRLISFFPSLENLKLYWCLRLEKIRIFSKRLKSLGICRCSNLKAVDVVDAPNLVKVSYAKNPLLVNAPDAQI